VRETTMPGASAGDQGQDGTAARQRPPQDVSVPRVLRDMCRMMGVFGINPGTLPRDAVPEIAVAGDRCAECAALGHCHDFLEGRASDLPQRFCPNVRLFDRIAAAQRRRDPLD
jgi:hypothetical protein